MKNKDGGLLGNFVWVSFERISNQLVSTIVSIILARLLLPADYGIIAIVNIFIAFANIFLSYGFNNALVQKKAVDDLDYSSVLFFNIFLTVAIYLILFFCAPLIAYFYGEGYEILVPVLRVLGLKLIITGVNSVQRAYISKNMMFKKMFYSTTVGIVTSAIIGIAMALNGFGVWALVAQSLSSSVVNTIAMHVLLHWRPSVRFSFVRLKALWKYGSFMLVSGILMGTFEEIKTLIIGRKYSLDDLAFYDKGRHFPTLIVNNVNNAMSTVLFPKMSNEQDDVERLKQTTRRSMRFSSFAMCPIILGFWAISENFVIVVLTEKWLPAVAILQCFCIYYLFQPMHTANIQAIKSLGRSDIFLKLEIIKKTIEIITLIITLSISVNAIVYGMTILSVLFTLVNAFPNKKLLGYGIKEQMKDIFWPIFNSCIMAALVYMINFLPVSDMLQMIIQIAFGAIVYVLLSIFTKNSEFKFVSTLIKSKLKKKER